MFLADRRDCHRLGRISVLDNIGGDIIHDPHQIIVGYLYFPVHPLYPEDHLESFLLQVAAGLGEQDPGYGGEDGQHRDRNTEHQKYDAENGRSVHHRTKGKTIFHHTALSGAGGIKRKRNFCGLPYLVIFL